MPQIAAFIPLITAVAGPLLNKALGGGGSKPDKTAAPAAAAPVSKNLFTPEQVAKAQQDYTTAGTAKWNQIMSGMGAGGGTGGPDISTQIGDQANKLGVALAGLNTDSGYGSDPTANMQNILKGVESGISPKYAVY
jgi:hypothetical protein